MNRLNWLTAGLTWAVPVVAIAVPINITNAEFTVIDSTSFRLDHVAAFGGDYWAKWEWKVEGNKWRLDGFGEMEPPRPRLVRVPAGTFIMGDGVAYCGTSEREVTLTRDFWIGQYEVTNADYLAMLQWAYDRGYVTATSSSVKDNLDGSTEELVDLGGVGCEIAFSGGVFSLRDVGHGINGDHPMKHVTWYGSVSYCDWLSLSEGLARAYDHSTWSCGGGDPYSAEGYRLPTDAEWEYAAQWNDERIYPWGDDSPEACVHSNYDNCVGWTSPVSNHPAGAQPNHSDPIHDLSGNVYEWVNDWWACDLGTSPETDPPGPESGSSRVTRGGSFRSFAIDLRGSNRDNGGPDYNSSSVGFRPARSSP